MNFNIADIVVVILLLLLLFFCFRHLFGNKKKKFYGCNHDCANCELAEAHGMIKEKK